jgi:hypothetical protein
MAFLIEDDMVAIVNGDLETGNLFEIQDMLRGVRNFRFREHWYAGTQELNRNPQNRWRKLGLNEERLLPHNSA